MLYFAYMEAFNFNQPLQSPEAPDPGGEKPKEAPGSSLEEMRPGFDREKVMRIRERLANVPDSYLDNWREFETERNHVMDMLSEKGTESDEARAALIAYSEKTEEAANSDVEHHERAKRFQALHMARLYAESGYVEEALDILYGDASVEGGGLRSIAQYAGDDALFWEVTDTIAAIEGTDELT